MVGDTGWELGLRLVLAAVFAIAAAGKIGDREGTRTAVRRFGAPDRLASAGAVALPAVELALAAGLLVAASARWAALGSAVVLAVFSAALLRARDEDCGCFGALGDRLDTQPLARNAVLIGAAIAVAVGWTPLTIAAVAVLVAGLLLVAVRALRAATPPTPEAFGDLKVIVASRSPNAPSGGGRGALARTPDLGTVAPAFALPASGGGFVTLPDLLVADQPVLLVFTSPACRPCDRVPARVARWRDELGHRLTVAVVSRADAAAAAREPGVLLQQEWEVARAYGAGQMPSALLIGADGRIASPLAVGDLGIDELIAATFERPAVVA